jgi:hypothetical protein
MRIVAVVVLLCGVTSAVWAQTRDRWEVSGQAGVSLYNDIKATGTSPTRAANAGFFDGVAVGAIWTQNGGHHWGGEFHYLFQTNNMRLKGADSTTGQADFGAQSHSFHYDAVLYFTDREARVRPFIAGGPGLKVYQATGQERAFRPLDTIVVFSHDNQVKFMASGGGGVKVRVGRNTLLRFDFRDYVTGIPKGFVTFPGVKFGGQFHNLVGTAGLGITF